MEQACEARATAVNGGETTVCEEADRSGAAEGVLEKRFWAKLWLECFSEVREPARMVSDLALFS